MENLKNKGGRPKGSKTVFRIKDVKPTLEKHHFDPIVESIKLFKDTKNEWLKSAILKDLFKYCYAEPINEILNEQTQTVININ
jgi:hypothetical protein